MLGQEIREVSERYVSPDVWDTELGKLVERKGLIDTGEISVSARSLQTKLKRMFNRINLGYDISLIVPGNLSLSNVDFKIDGKSIRVNVSLENNNG